MNTKPNNRRLLLKLHLIIGLPAALFLALLGISGAVVAFEPELDHLLNPGLYRVNASGPVKRLAELSAAAKTAVKGFAPQLYNLSTAPDEADVFLGRSANGPVNVYVDPYTAQIKGVRSVATPLAVIHQLHLRLAAGKTGQILVSAAAVLVLPLAITGLWLWWPVKRIAIATGASKRRLLFDVHNSIGFLSSVFLLLLSVTGATIGFGITDAHSPTAVSKAMPGAAPVSLDVALDAARHALPEASLVGVSTPGPNAAYRVAMRLPGDLTPGGRTRVWVDRFSGNVVLVDDPRTAPLEARYTYANRAIHTGDVLGYPGKFIAALASLAMAVQAVSGAWLWMMKRKVAV